MPSILALGYHILGLSALSHASHHLRGIATPIVEAYGGQYQFLTVLGLTLSQAAFALAVVNDALAWSGLTGGSRGPLTSAGPPPQADVAAPVADSLLVRGHRALLLVAVPAEILISVLYWSLRCAQPELVMPEAELRLPPWLDLAIHLVPAVLLTIEYVAFCPLWPIAFARMSLLSGSLALGYWAWLEHCFAKNGWYPYPILTMLSPAPRALLFATSAAVMAGAMSLVNAVHVGLHSR